MSPTIATILAGALIAIAGVLCNSETALVGGLTLLGGAAAVRSVRGAPQRRKR